MHSISMCYGNPGGGGGGGDLANTNSRYKTFQILCRIYIVKLVLKETSNMKK